MKLFYLSLLAVFAFASCNGPEQNTATGNAEDSLTIKSDTPGDTRGMKGAGVDNNGGTPGPGTITDTLNGKPDTSNHMSRRTRIVPK